MEKFKKLPFYLLLTLNFLAVLIIMTDYPSTITYDMHWGYEGRGWEYENRINYTITMLAIILLIIVPSIYALKIQNKNLRKAYVAISIPCSLYLVRFIYYSNFFNI